MRLRRTATSVARWVWATRARKVTTLGSLAAFAVASTAVAAFIFFSGASGTTQGTIETATINAALTVSEFAAPSPVPVGGSTTATVKIKNVDTATHTLTALTGAFSSSPSQCASHLSYTWPGGTPVGTQYLAGQTVNTQIAYAADASTPQSCSAATWTVAWTGTTNP